MRDVVTGFYCDVLRKLIARGEISTADSVLVVCGGPLDEAVMREVGFARFVISGLDGSAEQQDAERLSFADGSFDVVIARAGLHHCYSPHRALLEMYRVARKAAMPSRIPNFSQKPLVASAMVWVSRACALARIDGPVMKTA